MARLWGFRRATQRVPSIEFAVALCVLIAIAVTSDTITSRLEHDQYWVVHTHDVETALAQARGDAVAAEDSQQNFIITSDPGALAEYVRVKAAIPGELSRLQNLTSDNAIQQANVSQLRQVVGQSLGLLQQSIDLRGEAGEDAEQQKQLTTDGAALQKQALAIFDRMKAEEDRLMVLRQTVSAQTYRWVRVVTLASFAIVVLFLTINFIDLARELKERKLAEEAVQRLSGKILRVQDDERRRVARELHDSIGQIFALLKMNLEMISRTFASGDPKQTRELLASSSSALDLGLSGARTLSHLLHPPLLDEMGFASAAKWLAEGFSARSKVQVKLEVQPNLPRLHEDIELALFRILQEGLTNVHKHSESASVEITVKASASAVSIRMRDFGKGIPANIIESFKKSRPGLGVGLAGMRERIRDLGGHLELESDGRGAVIEASIPFASAAVRRGAVRTAPANARDSSPELS